MSWSRIDAAAAAASFSPRAATTPAINSTGADLLFLAVSWAVDPGAIVSTVSDSKGNTWTRIGAAEDGSQQGCTLFYCVPSVVGSGHTATVDFGASDHYPGIAFEAWSGADPAPLDVFSSGASGSGTTGSAGSLTPSQNGDLILLGAAIGDTSGSGPISSIDSPFAIGAQAPGVFGFSYGIAVGYCVQGTAGAVNPNYAIAANTVWNGISAAFKVAGGGGGGGTSLTPGVAAAVLTGSAIGVRLQIGVPPG